MASRSGRLALALALGLAVTAATPASAHKLKVFATADGAVIDGRVYFVGGAPAPGADVSVEAPPGVPFASFAADGDGRFRFEAVSRTDYLIIADTGDGHSARFTISAADLPAGLPPPTAVASPSFADAPADGPARDEGDVDWNDPAAQTSLRDLVAEAVASQIRPLREQLNDYEDEVRLRDIVGGIGYIFGLAGVILWLRAARRPRGRR